MCNYHGQERASREVFPFCLNYKVQLFQYLGLYAKLKHKWFFIRNKLFFKAYFGMTDEQNATIHDHLIVIFTTYYFLLA